MWKKHFVCLRVLLSFLLFVIRPQSRPITQLLYIFNIQHSTTRIFLWLTMFSVWLYIYFQNDIIISNACFWEKCVFVSCVDDAWSIKSTYDNVNFSRRDGWLKGKRAFKSTVNVFNAGSCRFKINLKSVFFFELK